MGAPVTSGHKLIRWLSVSRLISVVLLLIMASPGAVLAHEIRPAIADVTVSGTQVDIEIRLALETLVAGLDLTELEDTNASPLSDRYDLMRGLPPENLAAEFQKNWEQIKPGFFLTTGEVALKPEIMAVRVPDIGNIELPRESVLKLSAALAPGDSPVIFGWKSGFGPLVVRQVVDSGDGYSAYLTNGDLSEPLPRSGSAQQPWLSAFTDFIGIGFQHIVPKGLDHILFVLGLFFFSLNLRPLLTQITAFTIAHTVTLASASLGIIQVSAGIVEPLIAASIVYVAVENLLSNQLRPWRTAVVFGFGLLHGLGFASVLGDIGLDPGRFFTGLIGFNLGVELGQLAVIAAAFGSVGYWFGQKPWYGSVIAKPASLGIAFVGAYWFFQRVFF